MQAANRRIHSQWCSIIQTT